jgi:cell division protein FtsN
VVVASAASPPALAADASDLAGSAFSAHSAAPHAASPAKPPAAPKPPSATKPPATPAPAATASATPAASGTVMAQIGAFSSAAIAQQGWNDDAKILPSQMAGKGRKFETTQKDGKTYYRAFVAGFATRAEAQSFCAALAAKSKPCFVK